jgi:site-specific recombinase XerD
MEVIFLSDFNLKSVKRGRPAGKTHVASPMALCLHDLAFMRAVLQGLDLQAAGQRFLPEIHADLRVIRTHMAAVCGQAQSVLRGLGHQSVAVNLRMCLEHAVEAATQTAPYSSNFPSLAEFAEELDDPDAWSESELLQMYQERYPQAITVSPCPAHKPDLSLIESALLALKLIQAQGVKLPDLKDELQIWLSPALCARLNFAGIHHIAELTRYINARGRHWYRAVPGVGRDRATRLLQWLQEHSNFLGPVLMSAQPVKLTQSIALKEITVGMLRTEGSNALGAQSDQQALQSWIATLDFLSPHTRKAYSRDVLRFLLWAQEELRKGLADITVLDATAHARFLQNPPEHWCSGSHARNPSKQLTMRGALSPPSCARALASIGHFYGFLVETQYLKANPFTRVRKPEDRGIQMDVQRCFSNTHLQLMQQTLENMSDSPRKRRLKAILALLECTGLRIGEIPTTWSSVVEQFDAELGSITCLKVIGKGGRERLMPLKREVLQALEDHGHDQLEQDLPADERPLIGCIECARGLAPKGNGALSTARLRTVLVAFFREVAEQCDAPEVAVEFQRATPHFMRHTFAHRVLQVTHQDLAVTQQLLGHKSIATTGIYVKANLSQRLQAINSLSIQSTGN